MTTRNRFIRILNCVAALAAFVAVAPSSVVGANLDDYLEGFIGPQSRIIDEIRAAANAGDYARVWEHLSQDYTSSLRKEQFISQCRDLRWKLVKASIGRIYAGKSLAYAPIKAVSFAGEREIRVDAVVFWKHENGQWKLLNFPLLEPHFSEFGAIPDWLQ